MSEPKHQKGKPIIPSDNTTVNILKRITPQQIQEFNFTNPETGEVSPFYNRVTNTYGDVVLPETVIQAPLTEQAKRNAEARRGARYVDEGRRKAVPYIAPIVGAAGLGAMASAGLMSPLVTPLDVGLVANNPKDATNWAPFGVYGIPRTISKTVDYLNLHKLLKSPTIQKSEPLLNVGWAPRQTIQVSHASNKNEIPSLYFEKRWDVVNEGANPHGIWYQGKLGVPRTDITNPGKGIKAQKARDLFANRKYHLKGEITFDKPIQTIGDVKDRSKLSYDADNMGADGLIYNDIYDNGYNHNQVILGWKQFNNKSDVSKVKNVNTPTLALVFRGFKDKPISRDYTFFTTDPDYAAQYGKVQMGVVGFKNPGYTKSPLMYKDMEGIHFEVDDDLRNSGLPLSDVIIGKDKVTNEILPNKKRLIPSKGTEYVIWNPNQWKPL